MVTDTLNPSSVDDALAMIDAQLAMLGAREIVSASDVSNVLLDLRLLLSPIPDAVPDPDAIVTTIDADTVGEIDAVGTVDAID